MPSLLSVSPSLCLHATTEDESVLVPGAFEGTPIEVVNVKAKALLAKIMATEKDVDAG